MTIDMEQFKATYIEESLEGLDSMETNLLDLAPGSKDEDAINTIFRAAHSIKGGAATFGFQEVSEFTHVVETLLDEIRNGEREVTQEAIDLFLQSVDCLREMLASAQSNTHIDSEKVAQLKNLLDTMLGGGVSQGDHSTTSSESEKSGTNNSVLWKLNFKPYPNMLATGNDVVRMFRELRELGEFNSTIELSSLPALKDLDCDECYVSWTATLEGSCTKDQINEIFAWVDDDCELSINQHTGQELPPGPESLATGELPTVLTSDSKADNASITVQKELAAKGRQAVNNAPAVERRKQDRRSSAGGAESTSIRVDIEKIDSLINMVGELVITQSMLSQLGEDFDMSRVEKLRDGLSQLERNTRELQESVMRIRMIPISFAFNRFPRMIHDMCKKFGKKVQLKVSGESTELDKTVMEKIGDPLVHLVRNSMDHGIEMPDMRAAAGKNETGTLHLNAFHQGGNIVIEISDDGAGLNKQKILSKAIERGLVEEGVELSDEKIYELLFQPGFSTADQITDVSGRGVGMDVVRKNIQALGGTVDVASVQNEGTTFTIRLPLTLAILDGQLVRVGDQTYIIPLVSIVESLQVDNKYVNAIAGKAELYQLRDEYMPVIRLYEAFNIVPDSKQLDNGLLVIVEGEGQKAGLMVDDLLAQQQVVIKSLETNYRRVEGLSGATILGDGTVALILDIAGVIRVSKGRFNQLTSIPASGVAA